MECADDPSLWSTFKLTHVVYPKGDTFGYVFALSSLTPFAILIGLITLIVFHRDLHTAAYFAGILCNEASNYVLKHWIRQPRPCLNNRFHWVEFGMPSSHSQFMCFFTTYLWLFLFLRLRRSNSVMERRETIWKLPIAVFTAFVTCVILIGRVYLGYHTISQVLFGSLLGAMIGALWFCIVHYLLTPYFPVVASWRVSEFFMIRDCSLIPNVLLFEYTCTRAEARNRARKMSCHRY